MTCRAAWMLLLGTTALLLGAARLEAAPIRVQLSGRVDGHSLNDTIELTDPSQPISLSFTRRLDRPIDETGYPEFHQVYDEEFTLWINAGGGDFTSHYGRVQGEYGASTGQSHLSGSVELTDLTSDLVRWEKTSAADIPSWLIDLANHPERLDYSGLVTGGYRNELTTTLTIAPPIDPNATLISPDLPIPTPEPSALALFVVGGGGLVAVRRRRVR